MTSPTPLRVALACNFFPHYRGAVLDELLHHSPHYFILAGNDKDPGDSAIKEWAITDPDRFVVTPSRFLYRNFLWQQGMIRLALRRDLDVMIFTGDVQYLSTWFAAAFARLTGKRVYFWTHGWTRRDTWGKRLVRDTFYHLAHGLLLYGNFGRTVALERGFSPATLYVIYNSLNYPAQRVARERISPEQIAGIRQTLFPGTDRPLFICIARLLAMRGLDLLLDAMAHLKAQGSPVNLLLVGDGPERAKLEARAQHDGLAVVMYGACYEEEELAGLIMAGVATVVPAKLGLTAMHSLAYGTPVIVNDDREDHGPEWEAIIPGTNGAFFQRGNSLDLARVMHEWATAPLPNSATRQHCYAIIDQYYNPQYQRQVIDRAVSGEIDQTVT